MKNIGEDLGFFKVLDGQNITVEYGNRIISARVMNVLNPFCVGHSDIVLGVDDIEKCVYLLGYTYGSSFADGHIEYTCVPIKNCDAHIIDGFKHLMEGDRQELKLYYDAKRFFHRLIDDDDRNNNIERRDQLDMFLESTKGYKVCLGRIKV